VNFCDFFKVFFFFSLNIGKGMSYWVYVDSALNIHSNFPFIFLKFREQNYFLHFYSFFFKFLLICPHKKGEERFKLVTSIS
jgi:hypothetical protein